MDEICRCDGLFKHARETEGGESIVANVGRFGPYVKYGAKYASLKEDDPYTITLERAREVIRLKQEADASRLIKDFPDNGIQVLNGRYGPYITDKKKNAKIPKDRDPKSITLEEAIAMIAAAPERGGRFGRWGRGKRPAATATATAQAAAGNGAAAPTAKGKKPARKVPGEPAAPAVTGAHAAPPRAKAPKRTPKPAAGSPAHAKTRSAARAARKPRAAVRSPAAKPPAAAPANGRARRLK
jgi:DNA topoisomerase-1